MSSVTNLNRFRKQKARAEKRARADDNAARHGIPKSERDRAERIRQHDARHLDGHAVQTPQSRTKDDEETP